MPDPKKKKKTLHRVFKWLLTLVILGVVALLVWIYLVPMITANTVTVYDSYTAGTGDINTTKSFSAALSVKKSETFTTSEECTVRDIYVQSGDEVKSGDQLILLSTGELFTASFDGVVNEIRVKKGDWLWDNFTVVQICDLEHLEVSMDVDEYDVEELSVGQACTVRIISLGIDFDTVIAHINRVSSSSGTVAFYEVTCDLTVPENILPGMQATVTLPSDSVTGVVTLDEAALAFDEDQNPYVLLKQADGTYVHNPVEVGLTDGMTVEIKSGLTAGQTVYAVSGTESANAGFTLDDLYQMIFGKKTVINAENTGGGPGGGAPGEMPSNGEMPANGEMPQVSDSTQAASGTDATAGDGTQTAVTTAATDASGTDASTATGDAAPAGAPSGNPPSGMQAPQTSGAPDTAEAAAATASVTPTATPTISPEGGSTNAQ